MKNIAVVGVVCLVKVPWHIANRMATDLGGHLVTIDSEEEKFLLILSREKLKEPARRDLLTINGYWIGGSDETGSNGLEWINGKRKCIAALCAAPHRPLQGPPGSGESIL